MSKYDELTDAYMTSKSEQIAGSQAIRRAIGKVMCRLREFLECPNETFYCLDPEKPDLMCSVPFPPIKLDEDDVNFCVQARVILERKGHFGKMQFDLSVFMDRAAAWEGEFIFSVPPDEKRFTINPDDTNQIDEFCQYVFEGMLANLQGRKDWGTRGGPGMGFHTLLEQQ